MSIRDLFNTAHHLVEAKERVNISQYTMAERLGISARSYAEYLNGGSAPLSAKAVLRVLGQLSNDEIVNLVRTFNEGDCE